MDLGNLITEMDKMNMAVMNNLSGRDAAAQEHLENSLKNVKGIIPIGFLVFTNVDLMELTMQTGLREQ